MMNNAVSAESLRVVRGGQDVLHGLDFQVPQGSMVGLLGPSGCGKTTLMRAIVGVQVVAAGTVTVLGHPAGSRVLRDRVGYATQSPAVYADLTVAENLAYFASVLGVAHSEVARVIGKVGLEKAATQPVAKLSGGQLHRVSLAVALLGSPELLVLDEPTVGLDPLLREELWDLFGSLAKTGVTLLVSSHVMDEAARCERLILMRDGHILTDDTPRGLRDRTGTEDLDQAFLRLITEVVA
jgi:ABC-2 type transport system ATP-binding protein